MDSPITKQLVFAYLSGHTTPIETQQVEEWLRDPENQEIFYHYVLLWEKTHPQFTPDQEQALRNFWQKIEDGDNQDKPAHRSLPREIVDHPRHRGRRWAKLTTVAACVLLFVSLGWLKRDNLLYKTIQTNFGEITSCQLPDGSKVVLNANSSLRWSRLSFHQEVREVWLNGEAEFSVVHTHDQKPFIVKTAKDFQVEVLGTEFSLFSRERGAKVVLNSGKIRVNFKKDGQPAQITMNPGELLTLDQEGALQLQSTDTPEDHLAWREQRFVFDGTPISEICHLLEENFGVIVRPAHPEIGQKTISGNFKTETSDALIQVLEEVFDLEVSKVQDTLLLKEK